MEEGRGNAERVKQIYERIVDEEATKWSSLLRELCGNDEALETEVAELLALTSKVVDFIEKPILQEEALRAVLQGPIQLGQRIGPYVLVEQVGQGGTGVVFRARRADAEYQHEVAIKLVWPGFNREEVLRRFRQERQIQATLQHPHIARLLDGGTTKEGWPYIVMEFVEGEPLTTWAERQKLTLEERIRLFVQVCDAVAYAHRQQVVHRDLKPGNIFVTDRGEAKLGEIRLLDFGIAKILDSSGQPERLSLTQTGLQAMTPEYASPEQVLEQEVTEVSDLYSLGVVLYELLAGVHPLRLGSNPLPLATVLRAIIEEDPPLPSRVGGIEKARLRGDLDSIIRKAMRKEPSERYRSVFDLRNDLMRHLKGQPVEARRGGRGYRLQKWLIRRKDLVSVVALAALLLVGVLWGLRWWRASEAREAARQAWQMDYPRRLEQARQALEGRDVGLADRWLREDLSRTPGSGADWRGLEWGLLWQRIHGEQWMVDFPGMIHTLTFSPQQEQLSVISLDRPNANEATVPGKYGWVAARIDQESGEIERQIKIDPQSLQTSLRWIWTGGWRRDSLMVGKTIQHGMRLWDFETGREIVVPSYPTNWATDRGWGREEEAWPMPVLLPQQLAVAQSERFPRGLGDWLVGRAGPAGDLVPLFIWQNPRQLVGKTGPREMRIWDWETGRQRARFLHPSEIGFYLVDSDFHWIVVGGKDGELIVWDGKAIREQWRLTPEEGRFLAGQILSDPPRLVLGSDRGQLEVYDLPTGRRLRQIKDAHQDWINSILSLPRHGLVVTASHDKTLRFWDARTFAPRNTLKGFQGEVHTVTSNPAEKVLVTVEGQGRRTLKGWNLDQVTLPDRLGDEDLSAPIFDVAISRDGRRIAAVSMNGSIRLWDLPTGNLLWERKAKSGQLFAVAISPRGDSVAAAGEDRQVYLWESATGVLRSILSGHSKQIHGLAFSADGRWLASASDDRTVRVWDPRSGQLHHQLTGAARELFSVAFHPEGGELAAGSADGQIHRWSLPTGRDGAARRRRPFEAHQGWVWSLQYSPDGKSLLSGSGDWTAAVWELATGRRTLQLKGHFDEIFAASFSPDGERIATVSNDSTVRIWNVRSGQSLLTLRDHSDQVWGLALSPDGALMATGGWDGKLLLHRTLAKEEVAKRLERSDRLQSVFAATPTGGPGSAR